MSKGKRFNNSKGKRFNNRQNGKLFQFVARTNGGEYTDVQPGRSHPQIADRHAPGARGRAFEVTDGRRFAWDLVLIEGG